MVKTLAFCAESFAESARRAAGVEPMTCPPVSSHQFDPSWLEGWDLIYFDLHGGPGLPWFWGDHSVPALRSEQVLTSDLGGAGVFAVNCFLDETDSPMLDALLRSGAAWVIGGAGENYGGRRSLLGAPLLFRWFRRFLALGLSPAVSLTWAKRRLLLSLGGRQRRAARDALAFRMLVADKPRRIMLRASCLSGGRT